MFFLMSRVMVACVVVATLVSVSVVSTLSGTPAQAARSCPVTYVVRRGDSPWKVAQKTRPPGWTVADASARIAKMNPKQSAWMIGGQVCLPAGSVGGTAVEQPAVVAPTPPRTYTKAEIRKMIKDAFPDGQAEEVALYVATRESKLRPGATSRCCFGLFQIYYDWHVARLARLGIASRTDLFDPALNIAAAYDIYRTNGWSPWCTKALKARYPDLPGCR